MHVVGLFQNILSFFVVFLLVTTDEQIVVFIPNIFITVNRNVFMIAKFFLQRLSDKSTKNNKIKRTFENMILIHFLLLNHLSPYQFKLTVISIPIIICR